MQSVVLAANKTWVLKVPVRCRSDHVGVLRRWQACNFWLTMETLSPQHGMR